VILWLPGLGLEIGKAKALVSRPRPELPRPSQSCQGLTSLTKIAKEITSC